MLAFKVHNAILIKITKTKKTQFKRRETKQRENENGEILQF
jgi:hypothetical protein